MALRVMVQDEVLYEGDLATVPRVGDVVQRNDDALPVESVTWNFAGGGVTVTLVLGERPYTY